MPIIINQGLSSEYTFPRSFSIDPAPWAKRLSEMTRAYKHGAVITGDGMVDARPLRVWGVLYRATRQDFRNDLDAMEAACYLVSPTLHAAEWWPDRFLTVDGANFSREDHPTLMSADIEVLFRVIDPFWYSDTESYDLQSGLGSGYLASITNSGQIELSPLIQIRVATGNITAIRMVNESDNDREFTYTRNLSEGTGVRIRCAQGQVHRFTGTAYVDDLAGFSGTFYRLQPGGNNILLTLTGAGRVDITHYWRAKWLG